MQRRALHRDPASAWRSRASRAGSICRKSASLRLIRPLLPERCRRVSLTIRTEPLSDEDLVNEIATVDQALVIVNSRKHALDLYKAAKAAELTAVIHLTTRQTAADRRRILTAIRESSESGPALSSHRHISGRGWCRSRLPAGVARASGP